MRINAVTTYNYVNQRQNKSNKQSVSMPKTVSNHQNSPNFGILIIDDIYNWGVRKANQSLIEETAQRIKEIRKQNLDDVDLLSKRKGVSKDTINNYYGKYIAQGGIIPKYDGNEIGLNKIVGYSLEKFEILKQFIVPIMKTAGINKEVKDSSAVVPTGLILHGREGAGKDLLANAILEHLDYKAKTENIPIKTMTVSGDWWKGGTQENLKTLRDAFKEARKNAEEGQHTVMFIDKMGELLNVKNDPILKEELIKQTQHPKKDNLSWIGAVDDKRDLSRPFFRRGRTSMIIEIDKTKSESESVALLNHYIANTGRAPKYNEDYILGYIRNSKIPSTPKKIKEIVQFADDELRMTKDYTSKKKGTFISPIYDMQLMMGADFVSKYNRNKVVKPFEKPDVQIPKNLEVDTLKQFSD